MTMGSHKDASTAIEALDNFFVWEGMESPMVVKWMDTALQRRRREQHLASIRQGNLASGLSTGGAGGRRGWAARPPRGQTHSHAAGQAVGPPAGARPYTALVVRGD